MATILCGQRTTRSISFALLTRRGERSEMSLPKAEPYKAQGAPGSLVAPVCISRNLERAENQIETLRNSSSMYMSNAYLVENIRDSNIPVLLDKLLESYENTFEQMRHL